MRFASLAAGVALAVASSLTMAYAQAPGTKPAAAAPAPVAAAKPAAAPAAGGYSVAGSNMGELLGNPAAKAVLVKYIPDIANNPQIEQASSMTLKDIQQYAPDQLSDATLAKIDLDLSSIKK